MEPIAPPPAASPHPPLSPQRPFSVGEILDAAFDLVRRNAALLVGLSALVHIPAAFATAGLPAPAENGGAAPEPAGWLVAALALSLVALPIVLAALTDACGALLRGAPVDAGTALRRGLALALPLLGTLLVFALVLMGALLPLGLVSLVWSSLPGPVRVAAALGAGLIPLVVMLRLSLLTQVAVLEEVFGPRALARAHELIEGHVLRVFGIMALVAFLMTLLSGAVSIALDPLAGVGPIAAGLAQAVAFAYTTAVGVVLYRDVRLRRGEGDAPGPAAVPPPWLPPPPLG